MASIRTRFAPSPTGFLHVGGVRTALFAWLVAKQQSGQFILRIEDTDQAREVAGAEQHIQDSLRWVGVHWDESTNVGGPYAPYKQSERLDIYRQWAQKLVDKGLAYADPYTAAEVQTFRDDAIAAKRAFLYRDHRPENPPTWDGSQPLRLKSVPKAYQWHDAVMGDLSTGPEVIDDFILMKSDGFPTYNFCHIIDDSLMHITHVIRSQEFISSVPKYLNLYEALGIAPPIMATLPFVMAPDGNKKLGKRDGAKDILDYARDGYLPEAMMNFLVTLGWNDGSEQEIFSQAELLEKFSLDRVQKSGARFDEQRLLWLNGQWIRKLDLDDLYARVAEFWPLEAKEASETYKKQILTLVQDRLKTLADVPPLSRYFFVEPEIDRSLIDSNKQLKKLTEAEQKQLVQAAHDALAGSDFSVQDLTEKLNTLLETTGQKPGTLFSLIRIVTTWAPFSPGLAETMNVIGRDKTLARLQKFL
ncbi:MAG TPA: glutamate--tRNA ligase [Candidatus Saccharimonadales bacterium]|jgi:glutamyl-tRNA synthetase|nr:glutamate--tRNA ligase [Candidatus Saccharimonadales bacterium]